MGLEREYFPDKVDEEARRRFENALASGSVVSLEDYLPDIEASTYLPTLEEFVSITLEHCWQQWSVSRPDERPQPLEHYLSRFPGLADTGIRERLSEFELLVRRRAQDSEAHTSLSILSESSGTLVSQRMSASRGSELPTHPAAHPEHISLLDHIHSLMPHYEMIENISGGQEGIYRAYDRNRHKEVKLCHIPPPRGDAVRELKTLRAPYIVSMQESVLLPDGSAVLVMEQIQGRDLRQRMIESGGAISEETALKWMKQVCEGMTYVAARKVVHRNLKPANIVIDETGTAYVDDFQLATFAGSTDGPAGTPAYMPPELWQWTKTPVVEVRDDIYSFGATFYHVLTGTMPGSVANGNPVRPGQSLIPLQWIARDISTSTVRLIERCLAAQPNERFHSFVEVLTQLENPAKSIRLDGPPPDLSDYHLLSCLGEGGMGVVYKAQHTGSDRRVALKFIRSSGRNNLEFLARFRIEAEAVACLRHPNIVPVLDIGAFGGYPYFALEYIEGGSLHDRLAEFVTDPVRCAEVAASVAMGLHHAHRLGILHRDLKPQNILLSADGTPKITDFGLAKFTVSARSRARLWTDSILPGIRGSLMALDSREIDDISEQSIDESTQLAMAESDPEYAETITMDAVRQFVADTVRQAASQDVRFLNDSPTQRGDILGTPAYMAPEQTKGDQMSVGPWTDIYALGIVLYQMLTGRMPFQEKSVSQLFDTIQRCPPPPLGRDVPAVLVDICLRCLSKKPEDRYQSARELGEDLQRFVSRQELHRSARKKWWQLWR
ncbi:MAG: serine/threonine protein kinase [Planctomycetaceae bacterium]|nr:serine/threonine protein kinase [Planctomycetaceae bacterium]